MSRLQDKVAVITGGTSGIGLAATQRFVAEGAFVYIFARRHEELDETVASIDRNIAGVQGDVRKLEDLDRLYAKVASDGRSPPKCRIRCHFLNSLATRHPLDLAIHSISP
jgi:NAD(P)-dependent dehydrogenase (short-subunit alcohol dehydrogenase family)